MTSDIMTDFVEIPDDNSSDTEVQEQQPPPAPTSNNHEFDDLRTLKNEMEFRGSLLGKTWSELSNIMTRYQAQIIQKHEQLNSNLSGAERSRISQMDTNLKKSFSEIERLRKQVTDLESKLLEKDSEIVTLRTECHKYKNEVGMKDNLIHKIQAQMAQEALDYQTEISSLKDLLESGQVDYGTQDMVPVAMPVHQPPKRRKVTPKPLTPRTPQRVQPITPNKSQSFSSPQQQAQSMASTSSTNIQPGSAVVKAESFQSCQLTPSSSSMNQDAEMDASYADQTFEQDDQGQDTGYFKVDEVYDDSNSSAIEGLIQQQDPGMEQQAGQEQTVTIKREPGLDLPQQPTSPRHVLETAHVPPPPKPNPITYRVSGISVDLARLSRSVTEQQGYLCVRCKEIFPDRQTVMRHQCPLKKPANKPEIEETHEDPPRSRKGRESSTSVRTLPHRTTQEQAQPLIGSAQVATKRPKLHRRRRPEEIPETGTGYHIVNRKYICNICEQVFPNETSTIGHPCGVKWQKLSYNCKYCGRSVPDEVHLRRHMAENHGELLAKVNDEEVEDLKISIFSDTN